MCSTGINLIGKPVVHSNSSLWNSPRLLLNDILKNQRNISNVIKAAGTASKMLGRLFNRSATAVRFYRIAPSHRFQSQKLNRTIPQLQAISWNWPTTAERDHLIAAGIGF